MYGYFYILQNFHQFETNFTHIYHQFYANFIPTRSQERFAPPTSGGGLRPPGPAVATLAPSPRVAPQIVSVPRKNYMIEWSDQKVHEQKVAIFFYCDAKKVKKMSKDGFPTVLQISQDVVW